MRPLRSAIFAALAWGLGATAALAADARVIVGLKSEAALQRLQALSAASAANRATADTLSARLQRRANALATHAGVSLAAGRNVGPRDFVVTATGVDSATLAARLATHADVAWAVPDLRRRASHVPNDPLFSAGPASGLGPAVGQWYLQAPDATRPSATHAQGAWDLVRGSPSVVVAVLDTGVLSAHPDLSGRVLPGYDLVSDVPTANDGNGVDADANDPGDWITSAENADRRGNFYQCGAADSSWHGTQVAGIVGASGNNGLGMAGTAFGVGILPVRVLGKCGGFDSDIIAGMRWAAGVPVDGLPSNPNPARVLNLSLGGEGSCSAGYQSAIAEITAAPYHAVIVAAAGNSTGHAVGTPANCSGVIGVTGLRHTGSKVGFADLGPEVAIAAPAGNCVNVDAGQPCLYPILSTVNSGTRSALSNGWTWTDAFDYGVGTSFAAPIVAGATALMLSARPELTPDQVRTILQRTARPFPTSGSDNGADDPTPVAQCRTPDGTDQLQCYCTTALCGAGMLDIGAAVLDAEQGVALAESARQLMDHAEARYPAFFPGHAATASSGPFLYRHYPATGTYLAVAVRSDAGYQLNGVYVLGGAFGNTILYAGPLTSFITPQ